MEQPGWESAADTLASLRSELQRLPDPDAGQAWAAVEPRLSRLAEDLARSNRVGVPRRRCALLQRCGLRS